MGGWPQAHTFPCGLNGMFSPTTPARSTRAGEPSRASPRRLSRRVRPREVVRTGGLDHSVGHTAFDPGASRRPQGPPWHVAPLEPPGAFVERQRQRCWQASACLEPTRQEGSKRRPVEGLVGLRWSRLRWALMGSRAGIDQRSCPMEMVSPMPSGMEMRPPVFSIDRWWLHPHAYPWRGPDLSEGWEPRAEDRTSLA